MLDEVGFTEKLNKEIERGRMNAKAGIQTSTAERYLLRIRMLNDYFITHGMSEVEFPESKVMYGIIKELATFDGEQSPSVTGDYLDAVRRYSELMFGDRRKFIHSKEYKELRKFAKKRCYVEPRFKERTQLKHIKNAPYGIKEGLLVQFYCGIRIDEICRLKKSDFLFDQKQTILGRTVYVVHVERAKGNQRNLMVYLEHNGYMLDFLRDYMKDKGDDEFLFPNRGKMISWCSKEGIKSHDNRKLYIQRWYTRKRDALIESGMKKTDAKNLALEWTAEYIAHDDVINTKVHYLGSVWRKQKHSKKG